MKIINKVLSESLFQRVKGELKSKLHKDCWRTSFLTWDPHLHIGITGSVLMTDVSEKFNKLIHNQIRSYLPEHDRIQCNFHVFQPQSGIAKHNDGHMNFGATIYLNDTWDSNAGGWFVWEDEETKQSGMYKALLPIRNMMVLNDKEEFHWVTPISPICSDMRCSIQIWCFNKDGMIDNIKQEMNNESTKLDSPLPKGKEDITINKKYSR